jgi:hypothetical protein
MRIGDLLLGLAATAAACTFAGIAEAQSMTPMRGEVQSLSDSFAVRVFPANPYSKPIRVEIRVYDQDFVAIEDARISVATLMLSANASRPVIVAIPFAGRSERKVRVCAESIPFPNTQAQVRAQICGKFLGKRAG